MECHHRCCAFPETPIQPPHRSSQLLLEGQAAGGCIGILSVLRRLFFWLLNPKTAGGRQDAEDWKGLYCWILYSPAGHDQEHGLKDYFLGAP